jgi:predicted permease
MRLVSTLTNLGRRFRRRSLVEQDLDEEARAFIDLLTDEKIQAGAHPEEARQAALIEFGGIEQVKEATRENRTGFWLENLVRDLRYATRMLRRDRAFTLIAVVTLTLGIGANAAVFSVMRALLFRSLPVPYPDRLMRIGLAFSGEEVLFPGPVFDALKEHRNGFPEVMAWAQFDTFLEQKESSQRVNVAVMSGNGFSVLGLQPQAGRLLTAEDDKRGGGPNGFAAVISDHFWRSHFGGSSASLPRKLVVGHVPVIIVGVTPPKFEGLVIGDAPDLVLPLEYEVRANGAFSQRHFFGSTWLNVFGRRNESDTFARAADQLQAIAPGVLKESIPPQFQSQLLPQLSLKLHPGYNGAAGESSFHGPTFRDLYRRPLFLVQGLVCFLLLLCIVNLTALQFARRKARENEFAIRASLGASRSRLITQIIIENTLIGSAGGFLGLAAGYLLSGILGSFLASRRWLLYTHPDSTVIWAVLTGGAVCMVVSGLAPLLFQKQPNLRKQKSPTAEGGKKGGRLLIPLQVSVCMVLLVSAGLFLSTLSRLTNAPLGFDPHGVILFPFAGGGDPDAMARNRAAELRLLERLRSSPAVTAAAVLDEPPIAGGLATTAVQAQGGSRIDRETPLSGVGPGYLEVMRTRLLFGREFRGSDTQNSPPVCMVSLSAARFFFHGVSALGKSLTMPEPRSPSVPPQCEVVGITEDSRHHDLRAASRRLIYIDMAQSRFPVSYIAVRSNNTAEATREFAQLAHRQLPGADFFPPALLTELIRSSIGRERLLGAVSGFFAALALLVTGVGLYGFLAWNVVRRTGEIGIRVALGADQGAVLWMIAGETFLLLSMGVVLGTVAAYFLTRLAESLLYATSPTDPVIFCGAVIGLLVLGVLAAAIPTRRAALLEPMVALRNE